MIYLILCILANVGIFICFRQFKAKGLDTFQAIVFNYVTCVITGLIYLGGTNSLAVITLQEPWVMIAVVLGVVFISTFYLMALTTQKFSITVSSIASKMSLIIPVLISLFLLKVQSKEYTLMNYLGMAMALPAITFASLKKKKLQASEAGGLLLLLPVAVFLLGGLIDSSINYTSYHYLTAQTEPLFPIVIFSAAAIAGIVVLMLRNGKIKFKNIIGGAILGAVNYFSIFFLIRALTSFQNDGAVVYPMLNVGIILSSALISVIVFKEHLTSLNKLGLVFAIISIILLSFQELQEVFS